jgi:hypothetical protein
LGSLSLNRSLAMPVIVVLVASGPVTSTSVQSCVSGAPVPAQAASGAAQAAAAMRQIADVSLVRPFMLPHFAPGLTTRPTGVLQQACQRSGVTRNSRCTAQKQYGIPRKPHLQSAA